MLYKKREIIHFAILILIVVMSATFVERTHAQQLARHCGIPIVPWPGHPLGGQATFSPNGSPVILINPQIQAYGGPALIRFIIAHECAHHELGHMWELAEIQRLGQYALLQLNPSFELAADCWAAEALAYDGDYEAIASAAQMFARTQGPFAAPGYPSGNLRAQTIASCGGLS